MSTYSDAQRVKNGTLFLCPTCGASFKPLYSQRERGYGYCSRSCIPHNQPRDEKSRARSRAAALKNAEMARAFARMVRKVQREAAK